MMLIKKAYAIFIITLFLAACASIEKNVDNKENLTAPVEEKYIWELSDLYPNLAAWEAARVDAAQQIKVLKKFQGTLGQSSQSLVKASDQRAAT